MGAPEAPSTELGCTPHARGRHKEDRSWAQGLGSKQRLDSFLPSLDDLGKPFHSLRLSSAEWAPLRTLALCCTSPSWPGGSLFMVLKR